MEIFRKEVYPPHRLRDTKTVDGVKFNLDLVRSFLSIEHFSRIENKPVFVRNQTRTRTVYPN